MTRSNAGNLCTEDTFTLFSHYHESISFWLVLHQNPTNLKYDLKFSNLEKTVQSIKREFPANHFWVE